MPLIAFLILFPLLAAVVLLFVRADGARGMVVGAAAAIIGVASIALAVVFQGDPWTPFEVTGSLVHVIDYACLLVDLVLAGVVIAFSVRYRRVLPAVLVGIQAVGTLFYEFGLAHGVPTARVFYVDTLSLVMALIIGIIGSGICVYALGYMKDFQAHEPEGAPDRRPVFFALMFLFLSAMFLLVFADSLPWMFTGWEVTTVCSFLLIGYTRTDEAIANSFRQIIMNLLGGLGFLAAMAYLAWLGTTSFAEFTSLAPFIEQGMVAPAIVVLPLALLGFAGLTKAAQMPFHTWLLGAMVAPTPTSALLHSSTMVKAGVFLLIKMAPLFAVCTVPRYMVVLVGGVTFMLCSFMAISQTNAKRVLAYSTIANLGLIVACAGVGSPAAIWAAILLTVFHAAAKSLLFLCVGTAEHHIGSRDIEDMDLLFERMPRLARFMMIGIMCMFIAPFGMLLSKWAALASFADAGQAGMLVLLAFGSAATFLFWGKWLGKLTGIAGSPENVEGTVHTSEWIAQMVMVVIAVAICVVLPLFSRVMVEPYLVGVFGSVGADIAADNLWIASVMAIFVFAVLFGGLQRRRTVKADVYLSGVSADEATRTYRDSLGGQMQATARNLYLDSWFGEARWRRVGEIVCTALILFGIVACGMQLPLFM